jgi:kumamolisin
MSTPETPRVVGPADPDEPMTVTLIVRPRRPAPSEAEIEAEAMKPVAERSYAARDAEGGGRGADPADMEAAESFARRHSLRVAESDAARRCVVLTGRAADFGAAFGVDLKRFQGAAGEYRGVDRDVPIPHELRPAVESILGLDDRPAAQPRGR